MTAESEFLFRILYEDVSYINSWTTKFPIETDLSIQDTVVNTIDEYSRKKIDFKEYKNSLLDLDVFPAHPSVSESNYLNARLFSSVLRASSNSTTVFPVCRDSVDKIKVAIGRYVIREISFEELRIYVEDLEVLHPSYFGDSLLW